MTDESGYYENRFIAFLDILGFSSIIEQTITNPNETEKIHYVLSRIADIKSENESGFLSLKETGIEVSVFSDSIVISYPEDHVSPLFYLLMDVIYLQLDLMNVGVMLRGGITFGKLYHRNSIVYGPAMIAAYNLESKNAIYPRVIIDYAAIIPGTERGLHGPSEELLQINEITEMDEDHQLFVDFMSQWQEVDNTESYFEALNNTKSMIEHSIETIKNPNILLKYLWLKRYYNKTLDKLKPEYTQGLYIR